jgi:hypothetical protein
MFYKDIFFQILDIYITRVFHMLQYTVDDKFNVISLISINQTASLVRRETPGKLCMTKPKKKAHIFFYFDSHLIQTNGQIVICLVLISPHSFQAG